MDNSWDLAAYYSICIANLVGLSMLVLLFTYSESNLVAVGEQESLPASDGRLDQEGMSKRCLRCCDVAVVVVGLMVTIALFSIPTIFFALSSSPADTVST